jgi:hypothetical protein
LQERGHAGEFVEKPRRSELAILDPSRLRLGRLTARARHPANAVGHLARSGLGPARDSTELGEDSRGAGLASLTLPAAMEPRRIARTAIRIRGRGRTRP